MELSRRISSLRETATVALTRKVRALKDSGKDVLGLTLGEPDFDTPKHICDAASEAMSQGYTHYPPLPGYPALREAISHKLASENGLAYDPDQILVSLGGKHAVYNVLISLLNPGDHAILPAPFWATNLAILHLAQAEVSVLDTDLDSGFKISPGQLEAAIRPNTRVFFLNSPSNPSGAMYSREEQAALVKVLERHPDIYILADEVYEYFVFEGEHHSIGSFPSIADRVITINSFSKSFAMTGWRLGYAAGPKELIAMAEKLQGQVTSGAVSFAQQAGIAALEGPRTPSIIMREVFRKRRDQVYRQLQEIPRLKTGLPEGAIYIYPDFSQYFGSTGPDNQAIGDIEALCEFLIDSVGLVLVPGTTFGTSNHARISFAYSQAELDEALLRLQRGLALLKRPVSSVLKS